MIGWIWSPFREIRDAGIFDLFDALSNAIFGNGTVKNRLEEVSRSIAKFLKTGSVFLAQELKDDGFSIPDDAASKKAAAQQQHEQKKKLAPVSDQPSPISSDVQLKIDQRMQQCLEENLVNITVGMSTQALFSANATNNLVQAKCKIDQMNQALTTATLRL